MSGTVPDWPPLHRAERRGVLLLSLLCMAVAVGPHFLREEVGLRPGEEARLRTLIDSSGAAVERREARRDTLFAFDPNLADSAALRRLGFSGRSVANWLKYRRAGGRFRRPRDLLKVYGLDSAQFARVAPYLRLAPPDPLPSLPRLRPFPFDPNRVSGRELLRMGLPERVAKAWVNYRRGGGNFADPASLQRVYGLHQQWFEQLRPYIRLPGDSLDTEEAGEKSDGKKGLRQEALDINLADRAEWEKLRGIGPVLAGRILRFRSALGGFCSVGQVARTYGLPDSVFQALAPRLALRTPWKKWPVNQLDADSLARHPYLSARQARALAAYREQNGPFRSASDLKRLHSLPDSVIRDMTPYFSFDLPPRQ